jgi:putative ABC transport system permease protein
MFNRESLMEIDVLYEEGSSAEDVSDQIKKILIARHGTEDFTITTQEKMLDVLGKILNILTLAVGGLGGISLLVGGVGILTIMTIAVNERTNEIGLLRALGSEKNQILGIFLGEAVILASIGGLAGLVLGVGGAWLLGFLVPALPTHTSWTYIIAAELLAAFIGMLAGVLPARRAASLNPVDALRSE